MCKKKHRIPMISLYLNSKRNPSESHATEKHTLLIRYQSTFLTCFSFFKDEYPQFARMVSYILNNQYFK